MTVRAIIWRVVPWTVTIGAAAICFALWHVLGSATPSAAIDASMVGALGLSIALFIVLVGAVTGIPSPTPNCDVFGILAVVLVLSDAAVALIVGAVFVVMEAMAWPLLAITAAIGGGVILATVVACTALYVGTSDKRRTLRQEQRGRLEREALG